MIRKSSHTGNDAGLTNLLTLRLGIVLIFTIALSVLTVVIGCINYSRNMEVYDTEVREAGQALEAVTVYSEVAPRIILPPQPLSILCRGVVGTSGQSIWINLDRVLLGGFGHFKEA